MKSTRYLFGALGVFLLVRNAAHAQVYAETTDVHMNNFTWTPASGSLAWTTPWQLEASVSAFNSGSGFASGYQSNVGPSATATASIATPVSTVSAGAQVDASGSLLSLNTYSHSLIPNTVDFASTFTAATAVRQFEITGGTGAVAVTFSYYYFAHLAASLDPLNPGLTPVVDYSASMHVFGGGKDFENIVSNQKAAPGDFTFSGTSTATYLLQFNTPYSITYIKDGESSAVPEPEKGAVIAAIGLLGWAARSWTGKKQQGARSTSINRSLGLPT